MYEREIAAKPKLKGIDGRYSSRVPHCGQLSLLVTVVHVVLELHWLFAIVVAGCRDKVADSLCTEDMMCTTRIVCRSIPCLS